MMKERNENGKKVSNTQEISISDCLHKINSKFELNEQETKKLYDLKKAIISGVYLTEEGSFNSENGDFVSEIIPGNGKVCIKYFYKLPYPEFLILKKIEPSEKVNSLNSIYNQLEENILFFEEAKKASKRMFFKRLFENHKTLALHTIEDLNKTFNRSIFHRKTDEKALADRLHFLQKKGRNYVLNKAMYLENKLAEAISAKLVQCEIKSKRQKLESINIELKQNIAELRKFQNTVLLR